MGAGELARIAIVEDHDQYRRVLRDVIDRMPGVVVEWEAAGGREALDRLGAEPVEPVDLMIVDLSLPAMNGLELVAAVGQRWPATTCIVVSGHSQRRYVRRSLEAGARAYVLKGRPGELRDGITAALAGRRYLSPRLGLDPEHPDAEMSDGPPSR
jgi:DNA-binding NarL/FixJ family response regulator